jgi:4-amino-4-deoxy-L-arabinose transferase-like glycosyltransferase
LSGTSHAPERPKAFWGRVAGIAAAGLLLRLAAVVWIPTQPTSDFWGYYHRALNLAAHGTYDAILGRADASHPPLYALVLAAVFLVVPKAAGLAAAKVVNCFLGAWAIALAALLTRRLWGEKAGLVAAALLAFFPRAILMPCLLASENLYSPLAFLFVLLVLEGGRARPAWKIAAAAGLVVGLAALTRTVAYPMSGLWLLAALISRKKPRTAIAETLLVLLLEHAVMLPWGIRNQARLGRFTILNTAGGYGMFVGNNPRATGDWYDATAQLAAISPGVFARGPLAVSDASNAAAWHWIKKHPRHALHLYFVKFGIIFQQTYIMASFAVTAEKVEPPVPGIAVLPGPHYLKRHAFALDRVLFLTGWALVYAGAAGWIALFARARRTRSPRDGCDAVVLAAATLFVPVTSAIIAVNGRYRWPVEDLLVPAAAIFLSRAAEWLRERSTEAAPRPAARSVARRIAAPAALLAAAAIVGYQLFLPPVVGLADDGDFGRVIGPVGLKPAAPARPYGYVTVRYDVTPPGLESGDRSSEALFARLARGAARLFSHGVLDIRAVGGLHALVFLTALALLLAGSRGWPGAAALVFAGLLVFFFTDVGYASYLNSFYGAAASLLFLLVLAGCAVCLSADRRSAAVSTAYWLAALGLVTSKPQESLLAPVLGLLGFLLAREGRGPGRRGLCAGLAAVLTLCGAVSYFRTPMSLKSEALYNDVFFQLLRFSPDPAADMRALDLPPRWSVWIGTSADVPNSPLKDPEFEGELLRRVGYRRLVAFYLRRPARLAELFRSAAENAFRIRPPDLGNFPEGAGFAPRQQSRAFAVWSDQKARWSRDGPWLLPALWLGNLAAAAALGWRSRRPEPRCLAIATAALVAASVVDFLVCAFGDALADVGRHLLTVNAMTDLLLAADAAFLAAVVAAAAAGRRDADPAGVRPTAG